MPFTPEQVRAIAAEATRKYGKAGAERYMHKLKQEAIQKYGYFVKDGHKRKVRKKKAHHG